jgi:hypothetical protein
MLKDALALFAYLRPPSIHDNGHKDNVERATQMPLRQYQWQRAIANVMTLALVAIVCFASYALGVTPFSPGYATRGEVSDLKKQVDRVEVRQLEQTLLDMRTNQCRATDKRFYTQRLNELLADYHRLTGQVWRLPECDELSS